MNSQRIKIGVFIAIIGIASIIISQTANFVTVEERTESLGQKYPYRVDHTDLKNRFLYGGIGALILGAGISIFSSSGQNKQ
ncbi:MAG: hypothetical protein WCP85_08725 [Mariniphaga sp.]